MLATMMLFLKNFFTVVFFSLSLTFCFPKGKSRPSQVETNVQKLEKARMAFELKTFDGLAFDFKRLDKDGHASIE